MVGRFEATNARVDATRTEVKADVAVLRSEINRVRSAADELRDRYRAQYNSPVDNNNNFAFDEAHTTVINGRHRRDLA